MREKQSGPMTLRDVAARAGVSTMTVSRVLNTPARVSGPTRRRVEAALLEAGYAPDPVARRLATGSSKATAARIALIYSRKMLPRLGAYVTASLEIANQLGHLLLPAAVDDFGEMPDMVSRLEADGILSLPGAEQVAGALAGHGVPIVAIAPRQSCEGLNSVAPDDMAALHEIARHATLAGHRVIALISGDASDVLTSAAFQSACRDPGATISTSLVEPIDRGAHWSVLERASALFEQAVPPTALVLTDEGFVGPCLAAARASPPGFQRKLTLYVLDDYGSLDAKPGTIGWVAPVRALCRAATRLVLRDNGSTASGSPGEIRRLLLPRVVLRGRN